MSDRAYYRMVLFCLCYATAVVAFQLIRTGL